MVLAAAVGACADAVLGDRLGRASALAGTAFCMQFLVQSMFGAMPAHLNEISPRESRATFPGFTYQFGNFLAAGNATIQVMLAERLNGDYR